MSFTGDLCDGVAALLAAAGAGTYNPAGVYTAGQVGIVIGTVPQTPDQVVCITPYTPPDEMADPTSADETIGLQFWLRAADGDPRPLFDLGGTIFDALHGAEHLTFGSAFLLLAWRLNESSTGQDPKGRAERVANYYARVNHPTARTQ
jgi:hypothetical protein